MQTLQEICNKHSAASFVNGTDKNTVHTYIPVYEVEFRDLRCGPINLLEIGIASGHSLLMWAEYFHNGQIYGADISPIPDLVKAVPRITCIQHDSTDIGLLTKLGDVAFDIIIDDGCHMRDVQLATAKILYPKVKPNGLYIVEDVGSGKTVSAFKDVYGELSVHGSQKGNDRLIIIRGVNESDRNIQ